MSILKKSVGVAAAALAVLGLAAGPASADTKIVKKGTTTLATSPIGGPVSGSAILNAPPVTVSCTGGGFEANLTTNPGTPAAFQTTVLNFGPPCSDNIPGGDVTHADLVSGGAGTITVTSSGGNITIPSIRVRMHLALFGIPIGTCDYAPTSGANGVASNSGKSITFSNVPVSEVTSNVLCPDTGSFSVTFSPIVDADGDEVEVID